MRRLDRYRVDELGRVGESGIDIGVQHRSLEWRQRLRVEASFWIQRSRPIGADGSSASTSAIDCVPPTAISQAQTRPG